MGGRVTEAKTDEKRDEFPRPDEFLQTLVSIVNNAEHPLSISITLSAGGVQVSGMLAGGAEYYADFGREFASAVPGEDRAAIERQFAKLGDLYRHRDEGEERMPVEYIHVRNARLIMPGQGAPIPGDRGVWWRGRLTQVDGFFLGSVSVPES